MEKVFICSPMKGDVEINLKLAKFAARVLIGSGYIPIAPHLYFPQFLDDSDQYERIKGIKMGVELMKECDRMWIIGTTITNGMEYEINEAKKAKVPAILYDEKLRQIDPATILLDDRLDADYRRIVKGLLFYRY
jgi:hypothetical protein